MVRGSSLLARGISLLIHLRKEYQGNQKERHGEGSAVRHEDFARIESVSPPGNAGGIDLENGVAESESDIVPVYPFRGIH